MKRVIGMVSVLLMAGSVLQAQDASELKKENESLKRKLAELEASVTQNPAQQTIDRKAGIRRKSAEERKIYTQDQRREIETLYQSANKDLKNPEAKAALKSLIEKYPKANRTGCAVQYVAQLSEGQEREDYLKLAIKDFGDCFYGNGVQVGAYARFYLGFYYQKAGKTAEAKALFDEIRKDYPDAINHKGKRLVDLLPK